jgi:hypothetical protein
MGDGIFIESPSLTNGIFLNVNMAHTKGVGAVNRPTVVFVNRNGSAWVKKAEVREDVAKHLSIFHAFVGSLYLRFTRVPANSAFFMCFPQDMTAAHKEDMAAVGFRLVYGYWTQGGGGDGSVLLTPIGITEGVKG